MDFSTAVQILPPISGITVTRIQDHYRRTTGRAIVLGGTTGLRRFARIPDPRSAAPEGLECASHRRLDEALEGVRRECDSSSWQAFQLVVFQGFTSEEAGKEASRGACNGASPASDCQRCVSFFAFLSFPLSWSSAVVMG